MKSDACPRTGSGIDFKVLVSESGSRIPVKGFTVTITDISVSPPGVISNHLVCPKEGYSTKNLKDRAITSEAADTQTCGGKDITEQECTKKDCCFRKESCVMTDTDLFGNDIDAVMNVPSWEECEKHCRKNGECKFWTWVSERYDKNPSILNKW